ncbi:hypothetical protein C8R46DRAFT_1063840 [Mycena filopes]|nr:hypothetical protein C8R46DRAFT_1063840 [Mycena filopes]
MRLNPVSGCSRLWASGRYLQEPAPPVSVVSNTQLDSKGDLFRVVNVNSFQDSAVLAYQNFQFAAWYTSTGIALPHNLSTIDSHNVISLGVSPADGKIHVALDCHSTQIWVASRFAAITTTLRTLNIGTTITYPQFVVTPNNLLQFVFRSGLAEYSAGTWKNVGSWASATGTYTAPSGATSTLRNLYIHGFSYHGTRAYVTGTWREQNGAVSCSSLGLTNHDTVYLYSDDMGKSLVVLIRRLKPNAVILQAVRGLTALELKLGRLAALQLT